jgi:hypothetical protein
MSEYECSLFIRCTERDTLHQPVTSVNLEKTLTSRKGRERLVYGSPSPGYTSRIRESHETMLPRYSAMILDHTLLDNGDGIQAEGCTHDARVSF